MVTYFLINYNLLHQLVWNLDCAAVQPFLVTLLSPFESMHRVPKNVKHILYKWCRESLFFSDISEICLKGCKARIEEGKFDKDWKNSEMIYVVKKLEAQLGITETKGMHILSDKSQASQNFMISQEADSGRMWKIYSSDWFCRERPVVQ